MIYDLSPTAELRLPLSIPLIIHKSPSSTPNVLILHVRISILQAMLYCAACTAPLMRSPMIYIAVAAERRQARHEPCSWKEIKSEEKESRNWLYDRQWDLLYLGNRAGDSCWFGIPSQMREEARAPSCSNKPSKVCSET